MKGKTGLPKSGAVTGSKPQLSLKMAFKDTPGFISLLAKAGFIYAIVSFLFLMFTSAGTPGIINGQYVLHNHGNIIKDLTENEYYHYKAREARLFSGNWIAFYGIAAAVLYGAVFSKNKNNPIQNGGLSIIPEH